MEGHIWDLPKFVDIAEENNGFLIMDDAHGLGVLEIKDAVPRIISI